MKKRIGRIVLGIVLCLLLICVFASCGSWGGNSYNGTYYAYKNGVKQSGDWIKLDKDKWSDDGGDSGRLEEKNGVLYLYLIIFGEEDVFCYGTVKDGVFSWTTSGAYYRNYYADSSKATNKDSSATEKENGNENPVVVPTEKDKDKSGNGKTDNNTSSDQTKPSGNEEESNPSGKEDEPIEIRRTVSFSTNGGNSISNKTYIVGNVMNLPTPYRNGYTFIGWEDSYGYKYNNSSVMPDKDFTLYAKWEIIATAYVDDYVTFKPAHQGKKHDSDYLYYNNGDSSLVNTYLYIELTSDDLGGPGHIGEQNNLDLARDSAFDFSVTDGYTISWYEGSFNTPNGAQVFTLDYGSNIQYVTIWQNQKVVKRYLVDIYVKYDYYVNLFTSIYADSPYTRVRVVENELFPAQTEAKSVADFEYKERVYYNGNTFSYVPFNYNTNIRSDWNLYQTYQPRIMEVDLDGGTMSEVMAVSPYTKKTTYPIPTKDGYDFIGWLTDDGLYFTDINGFSASMMLTSENNFSALKADYRIKQYQKIEEETELSTSVSWAKTIPVVTYTDQTQTVINTIEYFPYSETKAIDPCDIYFPANSEKAFINWNCYNSDGNIEQLRNNSYANKPYALFANLENVSYGDNAMYSITLNEEKAFSSSVNNKTLRTYLPTNKSYTLSLRTESGSFKFTVKKYEDNEEKTYTVTSSSPVTIILKFNKVSAGWISFYVSQCYSSFTAKLSGATADYTEATDGAKTEDDLYSVGEDVVAETKIGYTWLGWYDGDEKVSEGTNLSYAFTRGTENKTYTAKWIACPVTLEKNIDEAGSVTGVYGATTVGEETTITATTNDGYTWLGWYDGETKVSEGTSLSYTFTMPEENKTYTAKWTYYTVTTGTNLSGAGTYTVKTNEKVTVGQEVTISAETNDGYTWLGWYDGDTKVSEGTSLTYTFTMPNESKTYTAKWYKIGIEKNISAAGTVSSLTGKYVVGDEVIVTAETNAGYTWFGWYDGETKVSDGTSLSYTFTMPAENKTYTAKWELKEEMKVFNFTSTSTTCMITSIKDRRSVTEIVVPDYVTTISAGAFSGCSYLQSITIPFVGAVAGKTWNSSYQYPLGYVFGINSYDGGTATEQKYYGSSTSSATSTTYYIPSTLKSVTVTGGNILYGAFYNCSGLTSVTIPDSVKSIGNYAFCNCSSLTSVTIPDSVKSIGNYAFCNCSSLTSVYYTGDISSWCGIFFSNTDANPLRYAHTLYVDNEAVTEIVIPDTVTEIKAYAFYGWNGTSITIPDSVTHIGYWAFSGCYKLVEVYNKSALSITKGRSNYGYVGYYAKAVYTEDYVSKLTTDEDGYIIYTDGKVKSLIGYTGEETELTLPEGITEINQGAFYDCGSLTSVTIPDSVKSIENYAFCNCSKLTSVTIGNRVMSIGEYAFRNCTSLTSITIPDSVTSIGEWAFAGCTSLTSVTIGNNVRSVGDATFVGCRSLTSVKIGNGVTTIGSSAFSGCTSLTSITIPDSVTSIGEETFHNCTGLTSVTIGSGITSLQRGFFSGCSSLESITIPFVGAVAGQTSNSSYQYPFGYIFGENSYDGGIATKQYYYGSSTSSTISATFYIPTSLRNVTVTGGNILYGAFYNCSGLTSITILDSVTSIGDAAFYHCTGLTSITIPASVTSIGNCAFNSCTSLTSITIPDSVTSIKDNAFAGCNYLVEVYNKSALPITKGSSNYGYVGYYAKAVYTEPYTSKLTTDENGYILYTDGEEVSLIGYTGEETELTLPEGITEINSYAFLGCSSLTSITIPGSVTSIGNYILGETHVTFQGTKEQWNAITRYSYTVAGLKIIVYCTDGSIIWKKY